jgi:hypothetical protein
LGTIVQLTAIIRFDCADQLTDSFDDVPSTCRLSVIDAFAHSHLMFLVEVKDGYFCY